MSNALYVFSQVPNAGLPLLGIPLGSSPQTADLPPTFKIYQKNNEYFSIAEGHTVYFDISSTGSRASRTLSIRKLDNSFPDILMDFSVSGAVGRIAMPSGTAFAVTGNVDEPTVVPFEFNAPGGNATGITSGWLSVVTDHGGWELFSFGIATEFGLPVENFHGVASGDGQFLIRDSGGNDLFLYDPSGQYGPSNDFTYDADVSVVTGGLDIELTITNTAGASRTLPEYDFCQNFVSSGFMLYEFGIGAYAEPLELPSNLNSNLADIGKEYPGSRDWPLMIMEDTGVAKRLTVSAIYPITEDSGTLLTNFDHGFTHRWRVKHEGTTEPDVPWKLQFRPRSRDGSDSRLTVGGNESLKVFLSVRMNDLGASKKSDLYTLSQQCKGVFGEATYNRDLRGANAETHALETNVSTDDLFNAASGYVSQTGFTSLGNDLYEIGLNPIGATEFYWFNSFYGKRRRIDDFDAVSGIPAATGAWGLINGTGLIIKATTPLVSGSTSIVTMGNAYGYNEDRDYNVRLHGWSGLAKNLADDSASGRWFPRHYLWNLGGETPVQDPYNFKVLSRLYQGASGVYGSGITDRATLEVYTASSGGLIPTVIWWGRSSEPFDSEINRQFFTETWIDTDPTGDRAWGSMLIARETDAIVKSQIQQVGFDAASNPGEGDSLAIKWRQGIEELRFKNELLRTLTYRGVTELSKAHFFRTYNGSYYDINNFIEDYIKGNWPTGIDSSPAIPWKHGVSTEIDDIVIGPSEIWAAVITNSIRLDLSQSHPNFTNIMQQITKDLHSSGMVPFSPTDYLYPDYIIPQNVTGVGGSSGIELFWDDKINTELFDDVVSHKIYKFIDASGDFVFIDTATTNNYFDSSVSSTGEFQYQITSVNKNGRESARSATGIVEISQLPEDLLMAKRIENIANLDLRPIGELAMVPIADPSAGGRGFRWGNVCRGDLEDIGSVTAFAGSVTGLRIGATLSSGTLTFTHTFDFNVASGNIVGDSNSVAVASGGSTVWPFDVLKNSPDIINFSMETYPDTTNPCGNPSGITEIAYMADVRFGTLSEAVFPTGVSPGGEVLTNELRPSGKILLTENVASGKYLWYGYLESAGLPNFLDLNSQMGGGFVDLGTADFVNVEGLSKVYRYYRSTQNGIGNVEFLVNFDGDD